MKTYVRVEAVDRYGRTADNHLSGVVDRGTQRRKGRSKEFQAILTAFETGWALGQPLPFVLLGVGILYTVITESESRYGSFGIITIIRLDRVVHLFLRIKNPKSLEPFLPFRPCVPRWHLCGKRQYRMHPSAKGRRHGSHLLDVGCLVGMATKHWEIILGYAAMGEE